MSFLNRLKNAWSVFKLSIVFLGKDKSLLAIPLLLLTTTVLFSLLFFFIFFVTIPQLFYIAGTLFLFFIYFWATFFSAAQSWMVHEVAQGKNTTVTSGLSRAAKNIPDILAFAALSLVISIIRSWLRERGNLGKIAESFIGTITGIAGKLVLPAMIITNRTFGEALKQLKESIPALPEIAAYEIGSRPISILITVICIIISVSVSLTLGPVIGFYYTVIWVIGVILFSLYIDTTYYTLVYLSLIEKKKIAGLKLV